MKKHYSSIIVYSDFETTTDDPLHVEVWSAASITDKEISDPKNVKVQKNLNDYMKYLFSLPYNRVRAYFHNEKFDGSFILYWLLNNKTLKQDVQYDEDGYPVKFNDGSPWNMPNNSFRYTISSKGQWYSITIKLSSSHIITIWDSLKLIPMSLKAAGKSFKTKHQKLEMDYKGHKPNSYISPEELAYIQNDVLVLKECMETMKGRNIDAMTIGSACLKEYKAGYSMEDYNKFFPDLTTMALKDIKTQTGREEYNTGRTADSFIRRSYHGGFCYVNPKYKGKKIAIEGKTCHGKKPDVIAKAISHVDANSHYPSMMHSKSGNYYPYGKPYYVSAEQFDKIKDLGTDKCYYFVRIVAKFKLKKGRLPMIQIKDDPRFWKQRNEWLESTDGYYVDIVLTCVDFRQMLQAYDIEYTVIEAVAFKTVKGLFDKYIDHWYSIKQNAKGAERQIAKLFLNNLYGKFAASRDSSYKLAYLDKDGHMRFRTIIAADKDPGYIAIGSAITSYARHRTITLAEAHIEEYVYSDTDSNVYLLSAEDLTEVPQDPVKICFWKVESNSDEALFYRQKTYIEHVVAEDGKPIENSYYNVKCCGMGSNSKALTVKRLEEGMDLTEFRVGYSAQGTLKSHITIGGTILVDKEYVMR